MNVLSLTKEYRKGKSVKRIIVYAKLSTENQTTAKSTLKISGNINC
jgi:hypothetical protein